MRPPVCYSRTTPRTARARIEHAKQIGERRDAADRRARGRRAALLLQRHGRRQAVDLVDLRNGHLIEEAPGVWRDRLEIAALRLGVERAERERRFPRARNAREDDERLARNIDVDVLEIVLARATHANEALPLMHS
jgi:hypothetical protein